MKKNNYIAVLEIDGVRRIFYFKSVNQSNVLRTVKRKHPDSNVIRIYPEPLLFD